MSVYFDNAILGDGRALVNIDVSFGDLKLYIPKTWKVVMIWKVHLVAARSMETVL